MSIGVSEGKVKTPVGDAPVVPLFLIGLGLYLTWFAVRYWRGTGQAEWPSYPIKSVLQGKGVPPNNPAGPADAQVAAYESGGTTGPLQSELQTGNLPAGGNPTRNQKVAQLLLRSYGWADQELQPLIALWNRESGWNPEAANASSGALGIAQALGHGGSDTGGTLGNEYGAEYGLDAQQARQANSGSVIWQIRWGLGYIRDRYGSPAGAWQHEQTFGWY